MKKHNNFDFLRLAFASIVMLFHCASLSTDLRIEWLSHVFNPTFAVRGFFVISGFLIFMSYKNSSSLREYFMKRVRRLYPAYLFTIFLFAVLLSVFSAFNIGEYFQSTVFIKYIFNNVLFLNYRQPCLPGVFEGNYSCAVNGALWTIKVEVMFYLVVPLIFMSIARYHKAAIFISIYLASVLYHLFFTYIHINAELARQLPGQLMFFIAGGMLFSYFDQFERYRHVLLAPSLVIFVANHWVFSPVVYYFYPLALSILVIYAATSLRYLGNFGKIGDLSYGIYIYHFPIIQLFVSFGLFIRNPHVSILGVVAVTVLLSIFSWHMIEKRFLKRSSHYVQAVLPG